MIGRYLLGYLVFGWFVLLDADHQRIDIYFEHFHKMQIYCRFVQQQLGAKSSLPNHTASYDHAIIGTKVTSDFVCNCINVSTLPQSAGGMATGNAIAGLVLATYSLLQGFAQIWANKHEYRSAVEQMQYTDMMVQYPHLVLIEYQIKIMQLLIDMCCHGTVPEQIFGRIHLVAMVLPGPYERYSKKQAKKLYKNYFDKQGCLISIEQFGGKYPYLKFHRKISVDWHQLVLDAPKYPTTFTVIFRSPYADIVHNHYNQTLLGIIDAGMHQDRERIDKLCLGQNDPLVSTLYSLYAV